MRLAKEINFILSLCNLLKEFIDRKSKSLEENLSDYFWDVIRLLLHGSGNLKRRLFDRSKRSQLAGRHSWA